MSTKKVVRYEYNIKCPIDILFQYISTPHGLKSWFASKVEEKNNIFTFEWGKISEKAKLVKKVENEFVKFHWISSDVADDFLEIRIISDEMTSEVALVITDFIDTAEEDAENSNKRLWDKQIKMLMHIIGS